MRGVGNLPKSRQSPSSIMFHSLTACPTNFIIFFGGTTAFIVRANPAGRLIEAEELLVEVEHTGS